MKKLRLAFLATLVCTAALLTSCIKEEAFEVNTAYLDVTFDTRATASAEQGDGIEDVMLWAFPCTLNTDGTIATAENKAVGWRTMTGLNTYQSLTAHLLLPMCGDAGQNYVLVAVINKGKFGKILDRTQGKVNGEYPELALNSQTTYTQLINASFDASGQDYWNKYVSNDAKTPVYMPVSHWTTVAITKDNTHPTNCKEVTFNVFRALAKSQLFMTKESDGFTLEVVETKLTCQKLPLEGILLSKLSATDLGTTSPTPAWFGPNPAETPQNAGWVTIRTLMNDKGYINYDESNPTAEGTNTVTVTFSKTTGYDFVGSTLIYEAPGVCTQVDDSYETVSGDGYYLELTYLVDDAKHTKRVAIPCAVVRNHDYQIKATVKNDGGVVVNYTVADWEDVTWDLAFDAAQNTNLLPAPNDNSVPTAFPTVSYTQGNETGAALFFFRMDGPQGITWKPTILNASADHYAVRVYEVIGSTSADNIPDYTDYTLATTPITGDIEAEKDKFYCIKVVALDANAHATRTEPIKLVVTHAPQWNEEKDNLLVVNPKDANNNYFWPARDADGNLTKTEGDPLKVYIYPEQN